QLIENFGEQIFHPSALKLLRKPFVYPPTIHILEDFKLSRWNDCKVEGNIHQLDVSVVAGLKVAGAAFVGNSSADFVLVPHCLGFRLQKRLQQNGWHWEKAQADMKPYFKAWTGALRRAGARALVVTSFMKSRLTYSFFNDIPFVISYLGPSDWLERNHPTFSENESKNNNKNNKNNKNNSNNNALHRGTHLKCRNKPASIADGQGPWLYPNTWSEDIVVHPPASPPMDFRTHWRDAASRDLLFSFAGGNTSCVREAVVRVWGRSKQVAG
ncbi:unnamed protein product, partial [Polarella glacialis]